MCAMKNFGTVTLFNMCNQIMLLMKGAKTRHKMMHNTHSTNKRQKVEAVLKSLEFQQGTRKLKSLDKSYIVIFVTFKALKVPYIPTIT